MSSIEQPVRIICVLGRGSSGKDTQVDLIVNTYLENGAVNEHSIKATGKISTGDIIRGAQKPEHPFFAKYNEAIAPYVGDSKSGKLMPNQLIFDLAKQEMAEMVTSETQECHTIFFTGFPRTITQLRDLHHWTIELALDREIQVEFVEFDVKEDVSRERSRIRREAALSVGQTPRYDDKEDVVENRLAGFRDQTKPMLELLENRGLLHRIDANGTINQIQGEFRHRLGITYGLHPERGIRRNSERF